MKNILLLLSLMLLTACSAVTTPGTTPTTPVTPTVSDSGVSIMDRLTTGTQYGSGQHTATLFADFQCPACIYFAHTVMPILEEYAGSGKLLITYKQFPLTTIHKNAYRDSLAALCARGQGKYMEYKKALYALEEGKAGATVTDDERVTAAKEVGLEEVPFAQCLSSDAHKLEVDRDMADADILHINATPTLFFDGKKLDFSAFGGDIEKIKQFFATRL